MEKLLGVFVLENLDGEGELSTEIFVHLLHGEQGNFLMAHSADEGVFKYVGKRTVSNVVQEDGSPNSFFFRVENEVAFALEGVDGETHKMEGSNGMLEAGVLCSWIDHTGESELLDTAQTIEVRVLDDVEKQSLGNANKSEYGVVDDFHLVNFSLSELQPSGVALLLLFVQPLLQSSLCCRRR